MGIVVPPACDHALSFLSAPDATKTAQNGRPMTSKLIGRPNVQGYIRSSEYRVIGRPNTHREPHITTTVARSPSQHHAMQQVTECRCHTLQVIFRMRYVCEYLECTSTLLPTCTIRPTPVSSQQQATTWPTSLPGKPKLSICKSTSPTNYF